MNESPNIASPPRVYYMKLIKKLLALPDETWGKLPESPEEKLGKSSSLPEKFTLEQNYPNPFNPETSIRYGIPSKSSVSIKIYDIMGREIAVVVDNETKSKGWYTAVWNGRDKLGRPAASGIYFCRLIVGNNVYTKKLMLVK